MTASFIDHAIEGANRAIRVDAIAVEPAPSPGLSTERDPIHWRDPDSGQACRCTGVARLLPHVRSGIDPTTRSTDL